MNIFILDTDPKKAAEYHCDKHVVKMILESAQLLSSAHWIHFLHNSNKSLKDFKKVKDLKEWLYNNIHSNKKPPYKLTHHKHPCSIWTRENNKNYLWLVSLLDNLCAEYTKRYHKIHKTAQYIKWFKNNLPVNIKVSSDITPFKICMDNEYKSSDDPVCSYRNYYVKAKSKIAKWKYTEEPRWYTISKDILNYKRMFEKYGDLKHKLVNIEIIYKKFGVVSKYENCLITNVLRSKYNTIFLYFMSSEGTLKKAILEDKNVDVNIDYLT